MSHVRVVFLGTGDAFSSGGSHHASYLVQGEGSCFLLDCGPSILASLKREDIPPEAIEFVLLSHLHGDHFAGLPFLLLEFKYARPRRRPLRVAGPPRTREKVLALLETMYPGILRELPFQLDFVEMLPGRRLEFGPAIVLPFLVPHQDIEVSLGLRVEFAGRKIVYTGDCGWTEELITRSRDADLLICECTYFETRTPSHLDYPRLAENRSRFGAARMILTHIGQEVCARRPEVDMELAFDGLKVDL